MKRREIVRRDRVMVFEKTHLLAQAARYQKSGRFGCFGQCGGLKKGGVVGQKNLTS